MRGGKRKGAGRPPHPTPLEDCRLQLPADIMAWMNERPESRRELVEKAMREFYRLKAS